ncbi:rhomboid family intramembrane serine protease [Pseudoruegeria sp. HB172150]|uniref:rhomboid family intramembrane serine protease n=1 Tax=Pseudoruegeria sp. HB172150 TaxID=2721164 RepID=UPI001556ADA7|nr:rhomboid family intramembrane serine protease [Pseudoruegeria sp. HB172150]
MFPIRDHNPSQKTPYVTYALIVVNIAVFLLTLPAMSDNRESMNLLYHWAMIPARISEGEAFYTLLTSAFLHGGAMHIFGNMLFLWIFGDNMEEHCGRVGFLAFYVACGVGSGLIHYLTAPYSTVPTVGASGAIAGVMGGYLLLFPKARVDVLFIFIIIFKIFPIPAWIMLGFWLGLQVVNGFGTDASVAGVAHWAHVGGFAIGFLLTLPGWLRLGGTGFWNRTHGHPDHEPVPYKLQRSSIPRVSRNRR